MRPQLICLRTILHSVYVLVCRCERKVNFMMLMAIAGVVCSAQSGNVEEVLRTRGVGLLKWFSMGNVRATPDGVAITLQTFSQRANGSLLIDSSFVLTITARGVDTVSLKRRQISQSVIYGDKLYTALYNVRDTLMIETVVITGTEKSFVRENARSRSVSINCIDGSIALHDLSVGYYVWKDAMSAPMLLVDPFDIGSREAFSIHGDLYILHESGVVRLVYGESRTVRLDDECAIRKYSELINPTIRRDTICWNDYNRSTCMSMNTRSFTCRESVPSIRANSCLGDYGSLIISPQQAESPFNDYSTNQFAISYVRQSGDTIRDTIYQPYMHSIGAGVGWWNGAFYFTAEVRDSGSPYESATSIIYKYTEPKPVVSVEEEPNPVRSIKPERIALTQGAFELWVSSLGEGVEICDVLGREIQQREVVPGVLLVRRYEHWWVVNVRP